MQENPAQIPNVGKNGKIQFNIPTATKIVGKIIFYIKRDKL